MRNLAIISCFYWSMTLHGQVANITTLWVDTETRADQLFDDHLYTAALDQYLSIADSSLLATQKIDSNQAIITLKIAKAYYKLRDFDKAAWYYAKFFERQEEYDYKSEDLYDYGEALLSSGQKDKAANVFYRYYDLTLDPRGKARFEGIKRWEEWHSITKPTTIEVLDLNTATAEIGARGFQNGVIYTARAAETWPYSTQYLMENMGDFGLFFAELDKNEMPHKGVPVKLKGGIFNVTTPAFSPASTVWVSASKNSVEKGTKLKLFEGQLNDGLSWGPFRQAPVDIQGADLIHPAFSASGDTVFFSAKVPESYRGYDIFYAIKEGDNWSEPVNLGAPVNSAGQELYPFPYRGKLYFSSNGHPGLGGLDNFVFDNGEVINLHAPLNTYADDFALAYITDTQGYLASNREGGKGMDDIYHFTQTDEKQVNFNLQVTRVWDEQPLGDTRVILQSLKDEERLEVWTTAEGNANTRVHTRTPYLLTLEKEGLITIEDTINVALTAVDLAYDMDEYFTFKAFVFAEEDHRALSNPLIHIRDVETGRREEVVGGPTGYFEVRETTGTRISILITRSGYSFVSDTLHFTEEEFTKTYSLPIIEPAETFTLNDLNYDLNQYKLKDDHVPTLDSIAANLVRFPETRIVVVSHTDSRGTAVYNLELSQLRAESVKAYLVSQGVEPERIVANGKGEAELLNGCSDGVTCTDQEHRANRRTEVQIFRNFPGG